MESKEIKKGAIIRLLSQKREFRITDIKEKRVIKQKLAIADSDKALVKALESKPEKEKNKDDLSDIFALL